VLLGYRNGKAHRKYVTRKTRREVVEEIRRLLSALRAGAPVSTGSCTVEEWFRTYLDEVARPKVRPKTFDRYSSDVRLHIVPTLGRVRLDKLRPAQLVGLYNAKLADGLSPRSVRHLHAVIRRALGVAVKWQLVAVNVATLVDPPSVSHVEIQPLTVTEAKALVEAARHDRLEARWLVGLALGLRQGEVLGLCWDDVDIDQKVLRVRRSLQRRSGGGLMFADVKTARSRRDLPLPDELVEALRRHRVRQSEERLATGSRWAGSACVFTTPLGTPIDPRNDFRNFKQLLAAAGLRDVRLHDLRHTAATLLLVRRVASDATAWSIRRVA
jgi:integrase